MGEGREATARRVDRYKTYLGRARSRCPRNQGRAKDGRVVTAFNPLSLMTGCFFRSAPSRRTRLARLHEPRPAPETGAQVVSAGVRGRQARQPGHTPLAAPSCPRPGGEAPTFTALAGVAGRRRVPAAHPPAPESTSRNPRRTSALRAQGSLTRKNLLASSYLARLQPRVTVPLLVRWAPPVRQTHPQKKRDEQVSYLFAVKDLDRDA